MPRTAGHIVSPAQRLNVAVGLFDQVGPLGIALHELGQRNLDLTRCRFVVARESGVFSDTALAQLANKVPIERITLGGLSIERAWSEVVVARALEAGAMGARREERACDTTSSILARRNQRLMQHLESGGGVLVVGLCDQAQQHAVAGLLLRVASGVFTHQLRAPDTTGSGNRAHLPKSTEQGSNAIRIA